MMIPSRDRFLLSLLLALVSLSSRGSLGFPWTKSSASATTSSSFAIEDALVEQAIPIPAAQSKQEATSHLMDAGVCRLNGALSHDDCDRIRDFVVSSLEQPPPPSSASAIPQASIPDTRLNCGVDPILLPLNHRTDMLLPLQDHLVEETLQKLIAELGPIYNQAVPELLSTTTAQQSQSHQSQREEDGKIHLLEAASLISECGATHQQMHADFRRDLAHQASRLPPRIVTFLYLQDCPTKDHGPTMFLPQTNTPEAHELHQTQHQIPADTIPMAALLSKGDVAIYDASVLHFGSANKVPENTRAVLYFGVGYGGDQTVQKRIVDEKGHSFLPPVTLGMEGPDMNRKIHYSWQHETLFPST